MVLTPCTDGKIPADGDIRCLILHEQGTSVSGTFTAAASSHGQVSLTYQFSFSGICHTAINDDLPCREGMGAEVHISADCHAPLDREIPLHALSFMVSGHTDIALHCVSILKHHDRGNVDHGTAV